MQELRALARGPLIGGFISDPPSLLGLENVSGASLRIDEYWLHWFWATWQDLHPRSRSAWFQYERRAFFGAKYTFTDKPPRWTTHCRERGYPKDAHPVSVVVIMRRPLSRDLLADAPRSIGPHPVVYEHRPPAAGYSLDAGGFVGGHDEGTLGGLLQHSGNRAYYLVSCAHVLGQLPNAPPPPRVYAPKPRTLATRTEVGSISFSAYPSPSAGKCNRFVTGAATVDVAVAEVDAGVVVNTAIPRAGTPSSVAAIASIGQGDVVSFHGYKSGHVAAKVSEASIWKSLAIGGAPVCFSDLFVIDHPQHIYITQSLAQPGDSGAWVVNTSGGTTAWYGMVIGGDGVRAYCCYAENVMNELAPHSLVLP
jgi:hypothetical protein